MEAAIAFYPIPLDELRTLIRETLATELEKQAHPDKDMPLTPSQAAEFLQVSKVTLFNWERKEKLMPIRRGGKVWYTRAILEQFLKE